MKKFLYNNIELTYAQLRKQFPNVSFMTLDKITQHSLPEGVTLIEVTPPVPTLEEKKLRKARDVRQWANVMKAQLQSGYSDLEVTTFDQQKSGADDILSGTNSVNAQFVVDLLTERIGTTPTADQTQAFAQLIISNWTTARNATVKIAGTQQRLEMLIRTVATEEEFTTVSATVDAELRAFNLNE